MAAQDTIPRGPGGRPKKAEAERRSVQRKIRWTIAEDVHLRRLADGSGLTVAEFVRRRALSLPVPNPQSRSEAGLSARQANRLIHELNAIGVNLNQIARNLNSDRQGSGSVDLKDLGRRLRAVLDRVLDTLA